MDRQSLGLSPFMSANVCLGTIGLALNRGKGASEMEITYLIRIITRADQEAICERSCLIR